eukprot:14245600-Ditylum_brightwellii.AAC.1
MQQWGVNFWETYSPVVNWITVCTLLFIASIHGLPTKCIDFVLAFPQARLGIDVFMELPIGMDIAEGNPKEYVLKLNCSNNGLKQSNLNWFTLLSKASMKKGRDFTPSQADPCLFIRKYYVLLVYVDDVLLTGKNDDAIQSVIWSLKFGNEDFKLTEEGTVEHYLGVELIKSPDPKNSSFEFRQSYLIKKIVELI